MEEITEDTLKKIIHNALHKGGFIIPNHASERMSERGYSSRDVIYILKNGCLTETAIHKGQNRYTLSGEDLDGHAGTVVVELRGSNEKVILVTVKK